MEKIFLEKKFFGKKIFGKKNLGKKFFGKKKFGKKLVLVLLSASVERFDVSRMRDFFFIIRFCHDFFFTFGIFKNV